jgi:hypothetical protein
VKTGNFLTGSCLLIPLLARSQQANVNLDCNPQKNTQNLVPFSAPLNSPDMRDDRTVEHETRIRPLVGFTPRASPTGLDLRRRKRPRTQNHRPLAKEPPTRRCSSTSKPCSGTSNRCWNLGLAPQSQPTE